MDLVLLPKQFQGRSKKKVATTIEKGKRKLNQGAFSIVRRTVRARGRSGNTAVILVVCDNDMTPQPGLPLANSRSLVGPAAM